MAHDLDLLLGINAMGRECTRVRLMVPSWGDDPSFRVLEGRGLHLVTEVVSVCGVTDRDRPRVNVCD